MINISFFFIYLGFEFSFEKQLGSDLSCNITTPSFTLQHGANQINPKFSLDCTYNNDGPCKGLSNFKFFDVIATPEVEQGGCKISQTKPNIHQEKSKFSKCDKAFKPFYLFRF